MKALETPEEKRARRLQKKEDKERKLRSKMGWDQEMMVSCDFSCNIVGGSIPTSTLAVRNTDKMTDELKLYRVTLMQIIRLATTTCWISLCGLRYFVNWEL